jgi:ABC-type glycerol-3-phosphate transport system substrate-binding protein
MKPFTKIVNTLVVIIFVVVALGIHSGEAKQVTLRLSHGWATVTDGNTIAFQRVLEKFAQAYPDIKFEIDALTTDYQTKLKPEKFWRWMSI